MDRTIGKWYLCVVKVFFYQTIRLPVVSVPSQAGHSEINLIYPGGTSPIATGRTKTEMADIERTERDARIELLRIEHTGLDMFLQKSGISQVGKKTCPELYNSLYP